MTARWQDVTAQARRSKAEFDPIAGQIAIKSGAAHADNQWTYPLSDTKTLLDLKLQVQHYDEPRSVAWGKSYAHLSIEERALIQAKLEMGCKLRSIARSLQRSPSTISRELKRCGWHNPNRTPAIRLRTRGINGYWCESAQRRASVLAAKPRTERKLVVVGNALWQLVCAGLAQGLSPQQVSGTLTRMDPAQRISHESIYTAIYAMPRGELRKEVIA